jgi:hypothetical protein
MDVETEVCCVCDAEVSGISEGLFCWTTGTGRDGNEMAGLIGGPVEAASCAGLVGSLCWGACCRGFRGGPRDERSEARVLATSEDDKDRERDRDRERENDRDRDLLKMRREPP